MLINPPIQLFRWWFRHTLFITLIISLTFHFSFITNFLISIRIISTNSILTWPLCNIHQLITNLYWIRRQTGGLHAVAATATNILVPPTTRWRPRQRPNPRLTILPRQNLISFPNLRDLDCVNSKEIRRLRLRLRLYLRLGWRSFHLLLILHLHRLLISLIFISFRNILSDLRHILQIKLILLRQRILTVQLLLDTFIVRKGQSTKNHVDRWKLIDVVMSICISRINLGELCWEFWIRFLLQFFRHCIQC